MPSPGTQRGDTCRKTEVEKYTNALMPANCWKAKSSSPIWNDRSDNISKKRTSASAGPFWAPPGEAGMAPSSEAASEPQSLLAAAMASSRFPFESSQRGLSGEISIPGQGEGSLMKRDDGKIPDKKRLIGTNPASKTLQAASRRGTLSATAWRAARR